MSNSTQFQSISDMFDARPSTAANRPPNFPQTLGELLERVRLAQMPMASSWALRPYTFDLPRADDYDSMMSRMEPVGYNPGAPQQPYNPLQPVIRDPANINRISPVR